MFKNTSDVLCMCRCLLIIRKWKNLKHTFYAPVNKIVDNISDDNRIKFVNVEVSKTQDRFKYCAYLAVCFVTSQHFDNQIVNEILTGFFVTFLWKKCIGEILLSHLSTMSKNITCVWTNSKSGRVYYNTDWVIFITHCQCQLGQKDPNLNIIVWWISIKKIDLVQFFLFFFSSVFIH